MARIVSAIWMCIAHTQPNPLAIHRCSIVVANHWNGGALPQTHWRSKDYTVHIETAIRTLLVGFLSLTILKFCAFAVDTREDGQKKEKPKKHKAGNGAECSPGIL